MESLPTGRSARKHRAIIDAARSVFLEKGYQGASMGEIAAIAGVSKQTVYKHFADKKRLFFAIVLGTTDEVNDLVSFIARSLENSRTPQRDLEHLGRRFITFLMQPELLRLRRLVIATADQLPQLGRVWYEKGFSRALATLVKHFKALAQQGVLEIDDPFLAANHFVGMLLWIPINQAMFTGKHDLSTKAQLDRYADAAVRAFMRAYGKKQK